MSLIDNFMTACCFVNATRTSDSEGGFVTSYTDGNKFMAAIVLDNSMQARIAEKDGVKNVYTVTTCRNVQLTFNKIIKRLSDGHYFRITSDGTDKQSPEGSTLDIRQASAERWELTE